MHLRIQQEIFFPAREKFSPQQIVDSVLFHNLSGQIDSSMHRSRSADDSAKLMIDGSQIQLQNVNTLNPDSILSQPAASQPASQPESKRQMLWQVRRLSG
jgi:hypothetical protein